MPPRTQEVHYIHDEIRRLLRSWGIPKDVIADIELLVGELGSNAVKAAQVVTVTVCLTQSGDVVVVVWDSSPALIELPRPAPELVSVGAQPTRCPDPDLALVESAPEDHMGLMLLSALADQYGINSCQDAGPDGMAGKAIWFVMKVPA